MNTSIKNNILYTLLFYVLITNLVSCGSPDSEDTKTETPEIIIPEEPLEITQTDCPEDYNFELQKPTEEIDITKWELKWEDEFNYDDSLLETNWTSQNGASGTLCSRWRENAVVKDGVLELKAKKEQRGGQDWTCGNIWTKETFGYGYYECKYKYAGASGTNNSFWLFPRAKSINGTELICELDVNEGHYPNEVNTNRHHWQNGKTENTQLAYAEGLSPGYAHSFNTPVKTKRIRFSSKNSSHFHIKEFRVYEPNSECYPTNILSNSADTSISGLNNLAKSTDVSITASGVYSSDFKVSAVADGSTSTGWVSQKSGEKWLEFNWASEKNIGHIQFINGWQNSDNWNAMISDYKIEAFVDGEWIELASYDVKTDYDFSQDYHLYGMDWSATDIKFYFDNKLIRTIPNSLCDAELNIFLSLAILDHAGEVTDAIDGTSMKIDFVKYYQKK